MNGWLTVLVGLVAALLGTTGGAAAITAFSNRKKTSADALGSLTDSALELVNAAKADAAEARKEATAARAQVNQISQQAYEITAQLREVRSEADNLVSYLRRVIAMIHDPAMTLERLRVLVGSDPPNGVSGRG